MPAINTTSMFSLASMDPTGPLNDPSIFRKGLREPTGEGFDSALRRALGGDQQPKQTPRQAAEEFISMALVQPILEQLRETNQAAGPFAPGDAEKRFGPMLDAEIAHRMVKSAGWGLVGAVASRLDPHHTRATIEGGSADA
jgi:Rod binding domain-containing protein